MPNNGSKRKLYHTGYQELVHPDVHYGRTNADFGQGFYLTDDREFALRWAKERKGEETIVNTYELELSGLVIQRFERDMDWFDYIYRNRNHMPDAYAEADLIIGPIANDTIFDTMGIITSGLLSADQSLRLLKTGPEYRQIVCKSERAASQLKWISAQVLNSEELRQYQNLVQEEEQRFLKEFAEVMESFG